MTRTAAARPTVVGILGGIASGKSTITKMLADLGAHVLIADDMAHEILQRPEVVLEVTQTFGSSVLQETDSTKLDRKKLATLVFGQAAEEVQNRKRLESIVQTRVRQELKDKIYQWRASMSEAPPPRDPARPLTHILVLDIPLLIERQWNKECDEILMIDTPLERRKQFASMRGWTEMQFETRESSQMPIDEKRAYATIMLNNNGTLEDLKLQLLQSKLFEEKAGNNPN